MALPTRDGYLYMHRTFKRKWERRFFKATRVYLQYFDAQHSLTPKGAVIRTDISSVRRDDSFADREHCILVSAANTKWYLAADSEADMEEWMTVLSAHLPAAPSSAGVGDEVKVDLSNEATRAESPTVSVPPLPGYMVHQQLLPRDAPPPYDECV